MLTITITRPGRDPETLSIDKRYLIVGSGSDADLRLADVPERAVEIRHTDDGSLVFKVLDGSVPMKLGSRDIVEGKGYRQPAPASGKAFKMTLTVGDAKLAIEVVDSPADRAKAMLGADSALAHDVDFKAGMDAPKSQAEVAEKKKEKQEEVAPAAADERLNTWFSVPSKDDGVSGLAGLGISKGEDGKFVANDKSVAASADEADDAESPPEEIMADEEPDAPETRARTTSTEAPAPATIAPEPASEAPMEPEGAEAYGSTIAGDRLEAAAAAAPPPPPPAPPAVVPVSAPVADAPPPPPAPVQPAAKAPDDMLLGGLPAGAGGGGGSGVPPTMHDIPAAAGKRGRASGAAVGAPVPMSGGAPGAPGGEAQYAAHAQPKTKDATLAAGTTGLPSGTIGRRTTVRYHKQMNPARNFPLLVAFSREQIAEIARELRQEVTQTEGAQQTLVRRDNPVVTVIPRFPGCLCVPDRVDVDLTPELASVHFSITPTATGDLGAARKSKMRELEESGKPFPSDVAYVEVQYEGRVINRVPTPTRVTTQRLARAAATLAIASPVFFGTIEAIGVEKSELFTNLLVNAQELARVSQVQGLSALWQIGLAVAGAFLLLGGLFWFINRPRAGEPIDRFLTVQTRKPGS